MTDTPRKTLTLKRKQPADAPPALMPADLLPAVEEPPVAKETRLLGKRIIRRDEVHPDKLAKPSRPDTRKPNKPQPRKPAPQEAPTEPAPSELQAKALDRRLVELFDVWRGYAPLALGIEAELYQFMDVYQPPASKRVVQRLLRMHCNHGKYLQAVINGQERFNLTGAIASEISAAEREHAARTLTSYEQKKQGR